VPAARYDLPPHTAPSLADWKVRCRAPAAYAYSSLLDVSTIGCNMNYSEILAAVGWRIMTGGIRVIDLTVPLAAETPVIKLRRNLHPRSHLAR